MAASPLCRTCMGDAGDFHYIFYEYRILNRTLPEIIDFVSEVKIDENDNFPQFICSDCIALAKSAFLFKEQCQRSDAAFKQIMNYAEKSPIKKELEQCMNNGPDFSAFDDSIKEENEQSETIPLLAKDCNKTEEKIAVVEYSEVKVYSPYQCAVCCQRFTHCSYLEEHVRDNHEKCDGKNNIGDENQQITCLTETIVEYSCDLCHKNFTEKRKLSTHTTRCEKRHKNSISDDMDLENISNKCESMMSDDLKQEDSDDSSLDEYIKQKKIKSEPEVLITTSADGYDIDFVEPVERKRGLHKLSKKTKNLRKNGISKKLKKQKLARLSEKMIDCAENLFESNDCDEKIQSPVPYSCTMCERKFTKKPALELHLKRHEDQMKKIYTCGHCKREFQRKGHLDNHILSHSSEKGFFCNICPKAFAKQESLSAHLATHKGIKKHQCSFCDKGFNVLSTLKDHIRTHTGEKPFLCSVCGKGFSQSTNLKEHLRRHQGYKPFKCSNCVQSFVSKGELEAHARKHSGAHPFVCDVCGGGFTTSSSLVKHKRIHTGEKPYKCDFCKLSFTALGTLKNHRRRHTGEKPYKCEYCEKAFAQKNDLVSHTRTHTGERPYVCSVCGHAFRQSSALKTHSKTHSGISDHEPIVLKYEKLPYRLPDPPPLSVNAIQLVSMMSGKECGEDSSSVNVMTPKSETSH